MGQKTCSREIVLHSAGVVFAQQGFVDPQTVEVKAGAKTLACIGAKRSDGSEGSVYACFDPDSCVLGDFEGSSSDEPSFYRVMETARHVSLHQ